MLIRSIHLSNKALRAYRKDDGMLTEEERGHLETKFYYTQVLDSGYKEVEEDLQTQIECSFAGEDDV